MANKIEYIFSLRDQISAKLAGITATSEKTRSALSGVQEKVRSAEDVFQDTGKTIGSLKARIDALQAEKEWIPADNLPAIKEYNREISRLTNELNELETAAGGGKFKKWASEAFDAIPGASLLKNPLVAGITAATFAGSAGMTFDENMAKVNITAQLDEAGLDDLKKRLKQIAADNKTDIQVVPVGFEAINSQVNDVELSLSILDAALKGSKAGFTDLDTVSAALAQTLSIVGKENTTAQEVLDTFFAAKRVGAGEFADFARYMPNLIAGADNLGITYKEVAGTFAYMTGKGQSAERAATLMENAFSVLGRVDVRKKLSAAGVDVFDDTGKIRSVVDIFTDLQNVLGGLNDEQKSSLLEQFGLVDKEAKSAFSVLMSDTEKLRESMNDVANSTGETTAALGYSRNAVQQATEVWNQFKNVGLQVGEIILPVISAGLTVAGGVLDGVSVVMDTVIDFFSGWYALIQQGNPVIIGLTTTLGILTAAMAVNYAWAQRAVVIGGIKKVLDITQTAVTGGLTAAQLALNAAFMASPLGWIAAGIGVVIGVVTLCWQKFEGFRMVVLGVWEVIKEFGRTLFNSIVAPFQKILSGIGSVGTAIVQLVKGNFSEAAEAAKQGFKEISQGVVTSNPVSIITRTIQNGDYSTAWEKGRQAGRDSWAASREDKQTQIVVQPTETTPLQPTSTPMASPNFDKLLASLETGKKASGKSKVLDLNETPSNLSESSAYSAITQKLKPREVSLLPKSMRKVAATVAVPLAMAASPAVADEIPVPNISDAYNVENIRETNNTFTADNSRNYNNNGRTYQIGKVCDEVVIHVANTDQKGGETIRAEILGILEELSEG
ncbi:phage tail tape measure protein [Phocaeicola massiliensis]|uniref:phage tail tape measure protein n=1 Tax=Phocaeicola massiliensis TaxID=204516 RepID=UPI00189B3510|nr:phage tail tape measure protein [Phocaeicola massiliensis]